MGHGKMGTCAESLRWTTVSHHIGRLTPAHIQTSIWKNRILVVLTFVTKPDSKLKPELGSEWSRVGSTLSVTEPDVLDAKLEPRTV